MSLDLAATLTPDDLTTAHDTELLEYLAGVNADAKRMATDHLRYPIRHMQLNAVLAEMERRTCLRLLSA
jgi:hypothetical protein